MIRLSFHGATETVTGSKYLLEVDGKQVLFDAGMFQGPKELRLLNWEKPAFDARDLAAVVLTHAHIDHIGYLPRVVRDGFRGPVCATEPTARLLPLQLMDSARLQQEDAEYANRKGFSRHRPALPLYDVTDVERTVPLLRQFEYSQWFAPAPGIRCRFHDTGHLLGAAMIEVEAGTGPRPVRILFSGDVGRYDAPLYFDPSPPPACDYLICESTYGDREHPPVDVLTELVRIVQSAIARGGVLVVPAFAIGRSQQLIYLLQVLISQGKLPRLPIYLDSPMAVQASRIYCEFADLHDRSEDVGGLLPSSCVLDGKDVHYCETMQESKKLNNVRGPAVILASSGMLTGGRILHHLRQRLPDPRNTILLAGFMAEGTRGRDIKEGRKIVKIHGKEVPVKAMIDEFPGMSGHADRTELLRWLAPLPNPRLVFITHGEKIVAEAFAATLRSERGWDVRVPRLGESFELESPPVG